MQAKKVTKSCEVNDHISRVVMELQEIGAEIIDPDYVANMIDSRIDAHRLAPHLTRYLAIEQLKNGVRKYLAHMFNPIEIAKQKAESGMDDLFDDLIQDHYPVKRKIMGKTKAVYIAKETMTRSEVDTVATTMEKAGNTLIEHAKALRAWFHSKPADTTT